MKFRKILPDVNLLLGGAWKSQFNHKTCDAWLKSTEGIVTCPTTELGFVRVSMSPAFRADFASAMEALMTLRNDVGASFLICDLSVSVMPKLDGHKQTTDCYLVKLAEKHAMRFATLDEGILKAPWARGIAFHPFR